MCMDISLRFGRIEVPIRTPDSAIVYESRYPSLPDTSARELVAEVLARPAQSPPLIDKLQVRRKGDVVIVISDITRPIPYREVLGEILKTVESAGVPREEIVILVATGMHRPSTRGEWIEMVSEEIVNNYRLADHNAECEDELVELEEKSFTGATVKVNRIYAQAGFRIITGLVEPHFMAGFSGGRKTICPGLVSLETVEKFHGYEMLADERSRIGLLDGNPCHEEALSVARAVGVDFSVNVVLDSNRQIVRAFGGQFEIAHEAACKFVANCACPTVEKTADVVITTCGGYPLDATFYQCVKGMVSALPALGQGGQIITVAGCSEGIGSANYAATMAKYSGRWNDFLADIAATDKVVVDQWQLQMQCRVLARIGQENLHFVTTGLSDDQLATLSVTGHAKSPEQLETDLQDMIDDAADAGKTIAVLPEGPYCTPMKN